MRAWLRRILAVLRRLRRPTVVVGVVTYPGGPPAGRWAWTGDRWCIVRADE